MQNLGFYSPFFLCAYFCLILFGCGGHATIPDAPPPYPTYSTPGYTPPPNPNIHHSQNPSLTPQSWVKQYESSSPLPPTSATYNQENFFPPTPQLNNQGSLESRYTIIAKGNIWVLIQDEFGTEIDWKKLSKGEKMAITHPRPITVTCSSGSKVQIVDLKGKEVNQLSNSSGIAIMRLP